MCCSFHALYLPAVLLALDLPLPKHLLTHGHWTMDKFKMSKSRGNVANPFEAMKLWGVDAMRMYLMRVGGNSASDAGACHSPRRAAAETDDLDSDYSATEIERFYRKDLAGQMGNLLNRVTTKKLLKKLASPELLWTPPSQVEKEDETLIKLLEELPGAQTRRDPLCPAPHSRLTPAATFDRHLASFEVHRAIAAVFDALAESNRHVQLLSPWLATASPSSVHRALFFGSETLRLAGTLLQPFMPEKSAQLLDMLGVDPARRTWRDCEVGKGGERVPRPGKAHLWPAVAVPEAAVAP